MVQILSVLRMVTAGFLALGVACAPRRRNTELCVKKDRFDGMPPLVVCGPTTKDAWL
jgi:hypothetical protein